MSHNSFKAAGVSACTVKHRDPSLISTSLVYATSTTLLKVSTNSSRVEQLWRAMPLPTTRRAPPIVRKLQTILIAIETSHFWSWVITISHWKKYLKHTYTYFFSKKFHWDRVWNNAASSPPLHTHPPTHTHMHITTCTHITHTHTSPVIFYNISYTWITALFERFEDIKNTFISTNYAIYSQNYLWVTNSF